MDKIDTQLVFMEQTLLFFVNMSLLKTQWTKFGFIRVIGRLRLSTILYPWLFYFFPFNAAMVNGVCLFSIKCLVQSLIFLVNTIILTFYFEELLLK